LDDSEMFSCRRFNRLLVPVAVTSALQLLQPEEWRLLMLRRKT